MRQAAAGGGRRQSRKGRVGRASRPAQERLALPDVPALAARAWLRTAGAMPTTAAGGGGAVAGTACAV